MKQFTAATGPTLPLELTADVDEWPDSAGFEALVSDVALGASVELEPDSSDEFDETTDALDLSKAAGNYSLLSAEEEMALGSAVQTGRAAAEALARLQSDPAVDAVELARLQAQVQSGQEARERLLLCNLGLVYFFAKKYYGLGVEKDDLIAAGIGSVIGTSGLPVATGLMHAIEKFDPERARFSTYAAWWVVRGLQYALNTLRPPIPISDDDSEAAKRLLSTERQLLRELQRPPSDQELAAKLETDVGRVAEVRHLIRFYWDKNAVKSLDEPLNNHADLTLMDTEPRLRNFFNRVQGGERLASDKLARVLGGLTGRRLFVTEFFLDGYGGKPMTEAEVVELVGGGYTVTALRQDLRVVCRHILKTAGCSPESLRSGRLAPYLPPPKRSAEELSDLELIRSLKTLTLEQLTTEPSFRIVAERAAMTLGQSIGPLVRLHLIEGCELALAAQKIGLPEDKARAGLTRYSKRLVENARSIAAGGFDYAHWEAQRGRHPTVFGLLTGIGVPIPGSSQLGAVETLARTSVASSQVLSPAEKELVLQVYGLVPPAVTNSPAPSPKAWPVKAAIQKLTDEARQSGRYVSPADQAGCLLPRA